MSTKKRVKLEEVRAQSSGDDSQRSSSSNLKEEDTASHPGEESSWNTDDEIADAQRTKSKKTLKRKRRATEPSQFGQTLRSLLSTDAPSALPLSLKPSAAHQRNDAKLEIEARKVIQTERKEREDRGRIRDVIGGWGGESERSLRKVAQRGVVKLFNTIQQSQLAAEAAEEEIKTSRGTGKPSLSAPSLDRKGTKAKKKRNKSTVSVAEKHSMADKDIFFDMIRSGGIVSKV